MNPDEALKYGMAVGQQIVDEVFHNDQAAIMELYPALDRLYDQLIDAGVPALNAASFIGQMVTYRLAGRVAGVESSADA